MSLTFLDWDGLREGTHLVPTPSLLVSPRWEDELPSFQLATPHSAEARLVAHWVDRVGRSDWAVGEESKDLAEGELQRVYVGYRGGSHKFKSVGDFPALV